ncbi:MAG: hypothetical protein K2G36_05000 [Ruminococcus sp.]|nr:hypothetical protein [Ruminococcus sp.]
MKKLFSAAASLVMAATMVGAVSPVGASAADAKKSLSFLAYKDATLPSGVTADGATITVSADAIAAGDVVVPVGMYIGEGTADLAGISADATVKSSSADANKISFKKYEPGADTYFAEPHTFKTADGTEFSVDTPVSFAGTYSARKGYGAIGAYQIAVDKSQTAAGTDNAFLGLAWTNNGTKYGTWFGEKSDTYPLVVFDVTLPKGIANGEYVIDFCNYVNRYGNQSCLLESTERYDSKIGNLDLNSLTIKVGDAASSDTTTQTTTTATTTGSGSTTTTTTTGGGTTDPSGPDVPDNQLPDNSQMVADSDIVFDFVNHDDPDGYWRVDPETKDVTVTPTLDSHGKEISGISLFLTVEGDFEFDMIEKSQSLQNSAIKPNYSNYGISLTSTKGEGGKGIPSTTDSPVFDLFFIPAEGLADGLYEISINGSKRLEVLDSDRNRYDITVIPGKIAIGDVASSDTTTTTSNTTTSATTTTTTTTASSAGSSATTTTTTTASSATTTTTTTKAPAPGTPNYGDTDCNGVVKINDVVLLNKWLNDNKSYDISEQGKLNADCFAPKGGAELTAEDSDAIIKSIVHLVTLPVEK